MPINEIKFHENNKNSALYYLIGSIMEHCTMHIDIKKQPRGQLTVWLVELRVTTEPPELHKAVGDCSRFKVQMLSKISYVDLIT